MKAVGITAEYNPFHLGHAYQLAETRRKLGEDRPVICVMSGSWVQRGECALTDKWTRAELALRSGADLILELPLPWAIASAESFARGAVQTLIATGLVDTISFGSESGDVDGLRRLAARIDTPEYAAELRNYTDKGISFAEARQRALEHCAGAVSKLLKNPNDNLAVEYIRAGQDLVHLAVNRQGVDHHSNSAANGYASATMLRTLAREGRWKELSAWTPPGTAEVLQKAEITDMAYAERAILARLRSMTVEDFTQLPDSGAAEGLPDRLVRAAREADSLEHFYEAAKTKRYAHARIRRLTICAFLGLTHDLRPAAPCYLRVLGMNARGRALLKEMKQTATLPILTKPAHVRQLDQEAQALFALECRATDLCSLCFKKIRPCGLDYIKGPVILL